MRRRVRVLAVAGALLLLAGCGTDDTADGAAPITVAAASDLRFAFEELGERFTDDTGTEVTFSFGSSGQLREQILNGAPFDVFASADVDYVDAVVAAGRGRAGTQADYALGRLALWAAPGVALPESVADLTDPAYRRIAVANPDHAPYGRAAVQALDTAGIGDAVQDRLVYGENISDTLRIARSGNADIGIVALSLVIADGSDHVLVPEALHDPLRQALVVTADDDGAEAATAFADFVAGSEGRAVMARYGFAPPDDEPSAD